MLDLFGYYTGVTLIVILVAYILAVCFSMVSHEYAHAYVAYKNGDDTAKLMGRLTFNPVKHFDVLGVICFFFIGFGWAKPVPINPLRFRNYKTGIITTSIAGVVVNFITGFLSMGLYVMCLKYFNNANNIASLFLTSFFSLTASINFSLTVFNLLPVYPLDGFNVLSALLPYSSKFVVFMRKYGQIILIILLVTLFRTGIFSYIIDGIFDSLYNFWCMIWRL